MISRIKEHFPHFRLVEPLLKGWSSDCKYYIETYQSQQLLLRLAAKDELEKKQAEYRFMSTISQLGIRMSQPIDFGLCCHEEFVFTLLSWSPGEDVESVLPKYPAVQQYQLGVQAGQILREIHTIPAPPEQEDWEVRFNRKIHTRIQRYLDCGLRFQGDEKLIHYLQTQRHLLQNRPQSAQHGDYHVGNLIVSEQQNIYVIDFNRPDYGDPWEEFNRIVWSATVSPAFATGQIHGYFQGEPPEIFFSYLLFYIAANTISSIPWAIPFGEKEVQVMKNQAQDVLNWFGQCESRIPTWYEVPPMSNP